MFSVKNEEHEKDEQEKKSISDSDRVRLICIAAQNNDIDALKKLITDVNLNTPYRKGFTALHYACKEGHKEAIEFLVMNGGDILKEADNGRAPFSYMSEETRKLTKFYTANPVQKKVDDEANFMTTSQKVTYQVTDERIFEGTLYTTTIDKRQIAISGTNLGSKKEGYLKIGAYADDKTILPLMELRKTEGHDFYVRTVENGSEQLQKKAVYGVFRTPAEDYDDHPAFGFKTPKFSFNYDEDRASWDNISQDRIRTHSPGPG